MREYHRRVAWQLVVAGTSVMLWGVMLWGVMLWGATTSALAQPVGPSPGGSPKAKAGTADDPLVAAMSRWDADHDGVLTCEEWKQYADRLFTLADKNHDGVLDEKEFQQIGHLEPVFSGADMSYFDDNDDKRISRSEFVDKPSPIFARYDTNHDCRVTQDEIKGAATPASDKGTAPHGRRRGGTAGQSGF
jgi:hypothetical protein